MIAVGKRATKKNSGDYFINFLAIFRALHCDRAANTHMDGKMPLIGFPARSPQLPSTFRTILLFVVSRTALLEVGPDKITVRSLRWMFPYEMDYAHRNFAIDLYLRLLSRAMSVK